MPNKSNKKAIEQSVKNLSEQIIESFALELWDVEFYRDNGSGEYILEITIDRPHGLISIDDCEKVTHALNPVLDEADPIEQSYSLVVSSPGIGRELKTERHIKKYTGKPVTVTLFAKRPGAGINEKIFPAVLKDYGNGSFRFEAGSEEEEEIILGKEEVARLCARDDAENVKP